jgi:hypothetical protein
MISDHSESMSGENKNIERFVDLIDEVGDEATGTFDILGVGKDERDHTRMLAWLLRPVGSHGLGASVIRSLLSEAELSVPEDLDTATISTFDQNPSEAELDIVIESQSTIIVIEIKTQGRLGPDQRRRQVDYLESVVTGDDQRTASPFESYEYIYLSADEGHDPDFVQHQVTWNTLLELITGQAGAVTRDTDAIRIREWTRFAKAQLTESESLSPATELQLAFSELSEQHDVKLDFATVRSDRQRLLSSYWQWLTDEHPAVAQGENRWEESRSRVKPSTKYIGLSKENWPSGLRFEIQATKERMTAGDNHTGAENEYRTLASHIEITLTYSGVDKEERDRLRSHLADDGDEILRKNGFTLIREALPDEGPEINSYHMYSRQVPINFSNPERTVAELRQRTNSLLQLEQSLDQFEI